MPSPGTIQSEVWTVNTDRLYEVPVPSTPTPLPLQFLAIGAEITGRSPYSFYSTVNADQATNDAEVWGGVPGGPGDYLAAHSIMTTKNGTVLVGNGEAGGDDACIVRSDDYGQTWTEVAKEDGLWYFQGIIENTAKNKLYAGAHNSVFYSLNDGASWSLLASVSNPHHSSSSVVTALAQTSNGDLYLGCNGNVLLTPEPPVIMKSTDGGLTWSVNHVFGFNFDFQALSFGINKLHYHKETDTLWCLLTNLLSGTIDCLWYKTGSGPWTAWDITPNVSALAYTGGATFDLILDASGTPTHVTGIYNITAFGTTVSVVWELVSLSGAGGIYNAHVGMEDILAPQWTQTMYQLMDLRNDISIADPGIYICGTQHLLKLNSTNEVDLSLLGPPFISGDVLYIPDYIVSWTTWGVAGSMLVLTNGMIRIPNSG